VVRARRQKGLLVAIFSGIMSACMSYGLAAAEPIKAIAIRHGTGILWQGLPALIVVLLGGFTTNLIWCLFLMRRNHTGSQFLPERVRAGDAPVSSTAAKEPVAKVLVSSGARSAGREEGEAPIAFMRTPLVANYLLCALAGVTWYLQFFFYTMGESQMGAYKFSSWTLHMASIILFSTLWGLALREWKGTSAGTRRLLFLGLIVLIASTIVVGYGNYLAAARPGGSA
jgi:L-rhamnose-H+ transport protein